MPALPVPVVTIGLLLVSNVFMTFAWYGHLRFKAAPLAVVIVVSWGIAFFEYVLQVPANRIGHGHSAPPSSRPSRRCSRCRCSPPSRCSTCASR
jgi:uncharacterized protein (DUF486 family)